MNNETNENVEHQASLPVNSSQYIDPLKRVTMQLSAINGRVYTLLKQSCTKSKTKKSIQEDLVNIQANLNETTIEVVAIKGNLEMVFSQAAKLPEVYLEVSKLSSMLQEEKTTSDRLRKRNNMLVASVNKLEKDNDTLHNEAKAYKQEAENRECVLRNRIKTLSSKGPGEMYLEKELQELQRQHKNLTEEHFRICRNNNVLEEKRRFASHTAELRLEQINAQKEAIKGLTVANEDLNRQCKSYDELAKERFNRIQTIEKQNHELAGELTKAENHCTILSEANTATQKTINDVKNRNSFLQEAFNNLTKDYDKLKADWNESVNCKDLGKIIWYDPKDPKEVYKQLDILTEANRELRYTVESLKQKEEPVNTCAKLPERKQRSAQQFLEEAFNAIKDRAATRDAVGGQERSMARIVNIFNAAKGCELTELDGWIFALCFKLGRHYSNPSINIDDFVDLIGYSSLAAECAEKVKE